MKKGVWIIGGIILTVVAFLIPDSRGYLWPSLFSAMAVVGIFFISLILYTIRNSQSTFDRFFSIGILILISALIVFTGIHQYRVSQWHHDNLMEIRKTIDRGILTVYMNQPLLNTLRIYHDNSADADPAIKEAFEAEYGNLIQKVEGRSRYIPENQKDNINDSPFIFYKRAATADSVILVGQSLHTEGKDSTFSNFNGLQGKMQYRAVLTKNGVDYEREN